MKETANKSFEQMEQGLNPFDICRSGISGGALFRHLFWVRFLCLISVLCTCLCAVGCVTKSRYQAAAQSRLKALTADQRDVEVLRSVEVLPSSIREELRDVADAGEPFSPGCGGSSPHERFLEATRSGNTFNVAIEQGGFIYCWFITQFVLDDHGKVLGKNRIEPDGSRHPPSTQGPEPPPPFVLVNGEVRRPGRFPWTNGITATAAISMAGGLTDFVSSHSLYVTHSDGSRERYPLTSDYRLTNDFALRPGDKIHSPRW